MEQYTLTLVSNRRSPQLAAACVYVDSEDFLIDLTFDGYRLEGTADDFFDSFCLIREQLEPMGLLPQCYAAHLHAFPSGMSRSMGDGLMLYRLELGIQARTSNLVHMFDVDEKVVPATVADQEEFFDRWIANLG